MSAVSMKQLLEAGVHFGHQTRKWNPKMDKYIFTARKDIHIIDLEQTLELVDKAYDFIRDEVKEGKTVLFVGTKKQAQDAVKEEAERCGMYYINSRWLGGTLTNFKTVKKSIEKLNKLNQMEKTGEFDLLPKKEVIKLKAERDKLEKNLGGIKDMTKLPGIIFVVDSKKEHICVKEAKALNIPTVGLIDTNCDPDYITHVIPGNDDAIRAISLFTSIIANAVIEADNDAGLKIIENLNDDDDVQTDAAVKNEDEEIVDYSNYQPTETKEEDVEADEKDDLVDEDKLYK